ncbi:SepM family pheromone-processing serine protease [Bacillus marinisedimentorum]|uniref:SepM family pheromone-processing serine protease n=1 Tax=Bacillus marinisedimentorum TaxID=1821260 RepID=UPI000872EE1E|nr:SepM family pheromone-processing serine protease [Bacillus marinisedimentorum]
MAKWNFSRKGWVLALIIVAAVAFIRLPYYVSYPGMAKELDPIIEVTDGYEEEGAFMLTTVRMGQANILQYVWAKFNKYQHLYPEEVIRPEGETDDEYMNRQLHMMDSSKEAAMVVAYNQAGKEVNIEYNGVYVMGTIEGMPAEEILQAGDRIHMLDGKQFDSSEQMIEQVSGMEPGEEVAITIERKGKEMTVDVPLAKFPDNPEKTGMGISLVTDRAVTVDPEVTIKTDEIGGPSAGLMFSLEIYNQLTDTDYTKGYEIAGTGSIDYDGNVGPIGGIQQKIVAADKAGADVFFAPNENGEKDSNYELAVKAAEDIDTEMRIVPVDTFSDALDFLKTLEQKKA